jgi:hypothetical protein
MSRQSIISKTWMTVLLAMAIVALALFVAEDLAIFNQNDFMYALAPAVWAQHGALYTDVPFVQAPLSILLNSLLVNATGNVNFYLLGRLATMLFVLLAVLMPVLSRSRPAISIFACSMSLCASPIFSLRPIAKKSGITRFRCSASLPR